MPGPIYEVVFDIAADQYGYVTQEQARVHGIPAQRLVVMEDRGLLERRRQGLYRVVAMPATSLDPYMEAALWPVGVQGVLSHDTALDLQGLSDLMPAKIHVTVPRSHRTRRELPSQYVLHREDLDPAEIISHEGIPIVTPATAIRQAHRDHLGPALVRQAIDDGERKGRLSQRAAAELRAELLGAAAL